MNNLSFNNIQKNKMNFSRFCLFKRNPYFFLRKFSTNTDKTVSLSPYQKKLALFFNHIIELSPSSPWQPNNLIFEENNDKIPKAFLNTKNHNTGIFFGSLASSMAVNFLITPYLTIIPMYYTLKYLTGLSVLRMLSNKIVKKMEIIDKECVQIQVFLSENKEKIMMNSLEIYDISKGLVAEKLVVCEGLDECYFVRFGGRTRQGKKQNFFMILEANGEKITSPKDRVKVLKTMFIEAKGEQIKRKLK